MNQKNRAFSALIVVLALSSLSFADDANEQNKTNVLHWWIDTATP